MVVGVFVLAGALGRPASAQYFGQNKVQYQSFAFEVLETEHFDIYFYPAEREGIAIAARLAERWHARLSRLLDYKLRGRQPLILYASHPHFEQTNVISGQLTEGTGGVTEAIRRRIVMPLGGPIADTDHVLGHELVHAFQYDLTTGPDMGPGRGGMARLPLWFIEGMAEYLSLGPVDPNTAMWLRDAASRERLPSIGDLDRPEYFPYRWGHAFWAYVGGRWGDRVIASMFRTAAAAGSVNVAIEEELGLTAAELSKDWQASVYETYAATLKTPQPSVPAGRVVVAGRELGGEINVGPAISPDGRWASSTSSARFSGPTAVGPWPSTSCRGGDGGTCWDMGSAVSGRALRGGRTWLKSRLRNRDTWSAGSPSRGATRGSPREARFACSSSSPTRWTACSTTSVSPAAG